MDLDCSARSKEVDQHSRITSHEILLLIMIHFAYRSKQDHSLVAVIDPQSQQLLQPTFRFPQYVNLQMISFHAHTHVIFVYGSEVSKYETLSKYMVIRSSIHPHNPPLAVKPPSPPPPLNFRIVHPGIIM